MQTSIFGNQPVGYDPSLAGVRRTELGAGAWIDYLPNWLGGHETVYADLVEQVAWTQQRRRMYERVVDVPRLTGDLPREGTLADLLRGLGRSLSHHYGRALDRISLDPLGRLARARLDRLGYGNVETRIGDGYYGWEEQAPFDAIIVTAAASHIPPPLVGQIRPGGIMVIPVGPRFQVQQLTVVRKDLEGNVTTRQILPVHFVPLTGEH